MNIEKVSIIVPVYNVEKYLEECIESILDQSYINFELILVDDGSTDKSLNICNHYRDRDNRIIVVHQENAGQSAARNHGIRISTGKWILFIDSDDVIHPNMLEFLIKAVLDSNANMSVCFRTQQQSIIPIDFIRKRSFKYDLLQINQISLTSLYRNKYESINDIYWLIYPKLIHSSVVKKIPFVEGRIFEDNEVACKWLFESKIIAIVPEDMYFYRDNPTGTMNQPFSVKTLDYLWSLNEQIKFFNEIEYYDMLDCIAKEYIGTTKYFCDEIDKNLNDRRVIKKVLRKTLKNCKKYQQHIENYNKETEKLQKMLHPFYYRIKKRLL